MWHIIKNILIKIQRSARRRSLLAATKAANKICLETGKTMLIYFYKGEFRYIAKQDMKKAGMSGARAEAIANGKIVKYMKPKTEEKPAPSAPSPSKLPAEKVKDLQEQTIKKLDKTVNK